MGVKVQVIFYSLYGHVYRLAEAVAEGARQVPGAQVELLQVTETLPAEVLEKRGAVEAKKAFAHTPGRPGKSRSLRNKRSQIRIARLKQRSYLTQRLITLRYRVSRRCRSTFAET